MNELKELKAWDSLSEEEKIKLEKQQLKKLVEELENKIEEYSFNVKVLNKIIQGKSSMDVYKENS